MFFATARGLKNAALFKLSNAPHISGMLYFLPILLTIAFGVISMRLSVSRTNAMLDQQSRPLVDPDITALTGKLAKTLDLPDIKVRVFEVDMVNGLAAPDGRIFLTRGFLNRKDRGEVTPEELASVIAHELGHVALGHSKRRMIDFTGQNVVFIVLSAVLNRVLPGIGTMIASFIASALMARLSQRDEFEADAYATAVLIKSGIGAGPQKSLFKKLEGLMGMTGTSTAPAWMLSHPKTAERIKAIEVNERRWVG
jgi:metalloprotease